MTQNNDITIEFDRSGGGRVVRAIERINERRYLIWSHAAIEGPMLNDTPALVVEALINEVERLRTTYEPNL
jgi:hypothetical protein